MIDQSDTDVVRHVYSGTRAGQYFEAIQLSSGMVVTLDGHHLSLYRDAAAIEDPFGQGLRASVNIPEPFHFEEISKPWIDHYQAGFIATSDQRVLLLLPKELRLYASRGDALQNKGCCTSLALS